MVPCLLLSNIDCKARRPGSRAVVLEMDKGIERRLLAREQTVGMFLYSA
jgi:hypothetical protein